MINDVQLDMHMIPVSIRFLASHDLEHLLCQLEVWLKPHVPPGRRFKQEPEVCSQNATIR